MGACKPFERPPAPEAAPAPPPAAAAPPPGMRKRRAPAAPVYAVRLGSAELDRLWNALVAEGGEESMCGWCKDRFGVSWQIVPRMLNPLLQHADDAVRMRAWETMVKMRKLVIADFV